MSGRLWMFLVITACFLSFALVRVTDDYLFTPQSGYYNCVSLAAHEAHNRAEFRAIVKGSCSSLEGK